MKIKTFEKIFIVVAILLFCFVAFRYIIASSEGQRLLSRIEKIAIRKDNSEYLNRTNSQKNYDMKTLMLKWEDGKPLLYDDLNVVHNFSLYNKDGKIAIKRSMNIPRAGYVIEVEGVREYFTRQEEIITDIPYIESVETFLIKEQEDMFPIFGYHNVFKEEDDIVDPYVDMRERDFEAQLLFMNNGLNCRWFTLADLLRNYVLQEIKIPRDSCVLTFDDGRRNNATTVLPLLKKYDVTASFFIIGGRIGQESYMDASELKDLFQAGNDIQAHAFTGGSLVDTEWFGKEFTTVDLWDQIDGVKKVLESYGYDAGLFAYPLGDWNEQVLSDIKKAGYVAARDIQKESRWRDKRALAISTDPEFIWHFNYYEPQLFDSAKIASEASYNGRWQFEEGAYITDVGGKKANVSSTIKPTEKSFGTVFLEDTGDAVENTFLLEQSGRHVIDVLGLSSTSEGISFSIKVDGIRYELQKDSNQACARYEDKEFCHFLLSADLASGRHSLKVESMNGRSVLDYFQIFRVIKATNEYQIKIYDFHSEH